MLIAVTQECISELKAWKAGMESKGLRVNMKKTNFMVSGVDLDVLQKSGNYPCAVCCKSVGNNSTECLQCKLWVHKRCSGITGWLVNVCNYICPRCKSETRPIDCTLMTQVDVKGTQLDVDTFCYLGVMLCYGGGCDSAIVTRYCVAWGKFRKLLPVLTSRHLSPNVRGKVYTGCVHWLCSMVTKHGVKMTSSNVNISTFLPLYVESQVNSPRKGQWRGALVFSLICAWLNSWVNTCKAGNLKCHCAHYDVTVMSWAYTAPWSTGFVAPKTSRAWNILSLTTPETWH